MKRIKKSRRPVSRDVTETFLEFAAPLLEAVEDGDLDGLRTALRIATVCWNMGAMELAGHPVFEEGLAGLAAQGAGSVEAFEFLVSRRVMDYGEHPWVVGEATVSETKGKVTVRVASRRLGDAEGV